MTVAIGTEDLLGLGLGLEGIEDAQWDTGRRSHRGLCFWWQDKGEMIIPRHECAKYIQGRQEGRQAGVSPFNIIFGHDDW